MKKMGRSPREGISQLGFEAQVELCWTLKKKKGGGGRVIEMTHTLSQRTTAL